MPFSKEDLSGLYNWSPDSKTTVFKGTPTRRSFDRYNGNQVLFIINNLLEVVGDFAKEGVKIEKLILNKLPFEQSSELTVFNWLHEELNKKEPQII